jgi:hypothetical protein
MYALARGRRRHFYGPPAPIVSAGRSGADENARLEWLRRQYPRWLIWRGSFTGAYWAMPPRGHPARRELISGRDLDELTLRLAEAEEWHGR